MMGAKIMSDLYNTIETLCVKKGITITTPVSYTHLDVYKRQGYNAQALLSWLAQNNYLQTSKPHLTKTVRINNIPTRCVVLRLPQLENDDFEPLGYIPD